MNYDDQPQFIKNSTIRSEYAEARANDVISDDPKSLNRAIPQAFANLEKDLHALGEISNVLNCKVNYNPLRQQEPFQLNNLPGLHLKMLRIQLPYLLQHEIPQHDLDDKQYLAHQHPSRLQVNCVKPISVH